MALFTLAATKENSFAAFALGKLYLAGDAALPRDPAAALKWLTYAAELGNQFAQYRLGKLLLKGDDGIPKDVITAIRWLTAAAKQENGYAEYALALVYLTGEDAPKDSVKALSLLKRSAGRGNQFAQYRLGKLLLQGEDAPKDVKAAIRWLTAAAEQGNQYAQYALGKLYLLGKEVPKDRSSAIKWFQLAADQGNEYAQYFLKHMDDRLGQPPVAAVISLFHHLANIFQEQNQPPPSGAFGSRWIGSSYEKSRRRRSLRATRRMTMSRKCSYKGGNLLKQKVQFKQQILLAQPKGIQGLKRQKPIPCRPVLFHRKLKGRNQ